MPKFRSPSDMQGDVETIQQTMNSLKGEIESLQADSDKNRLKLHDVQPASEEWKQLRQVIRDAENRVDEIASELSDLKPALNAKELQEARRKVSELDAQLRTGFVEYQQEEQKFLDHIGSLFWLFQQMHNTSADMERMLLRFRELRKQHGLWSGDCEPSERRDRNGNAIWARSPLEGQPCPSKNVGYDFSSFLLNVLTDLQNGISKIDGVPSAAWKDLSQLEPSERVPPVGHMDRSETVIERLDLREKN